MPGRVNRMELTDLSGFSDLSVVNEMKEDYFREIANSTVRPVLLRLKTVFDRHRGRVSWNHIVAIGLKLYSLHKAGYDIDLATARVFNKKFGLPDAVLRDIVNAVQAAIGTPRGRR